jgi:hypothetical protein
MKHKRKSFGALAATLITFGSFSGAVNAALIMHVNTVSKTLTMSGSGITNSSGFNGYWILSAPTQTGSSGVEPKFDISPLINLQGADWQFGWGALSYNNSSPANSIMFGGNLSNISNGTVTMTPTGASISYAGANAAIIQRLEANLEVTWIPAFGSGTEGLFVTTNPIPEPSAAILFGLSAMTLVFLRRRIA